MQKLSDVFGKPKKPAAVKAVQDAEEKAAAEKAAAEKAAAEKAAAEKAAAEKAAAEKAAAASGADAQVAEDVVPGGAVVTPTEPSNPVASKSNVQELLAANVARGAAVEEAPPSRFCPRCDKPKLDDPFLVCPACRSLTRDELETCEDCKLARRSDPDAMQCQKHGERWSFWCFKEASQAK
jgi:hypothetical protein